MLANSRVLQTKVAEACVLIFWEMSPIFLLDVSAHINEFEGVVPAFAMTLCKWLPLSS